MRIDAIVFERAQLGWGCTIVFPLTTTRQFTDETASVKAGSRWRWLAFLRAKRAMRELIRIQGAKSGERAAIGWAD
jgi:hypothetical protein